MTFKPHSPLMQAVLTATLTFLGTAGVIWARTQRTDIALMAGTLCAIVAFQMVHSLNKK